MPLGLLNENTALLIGGLILLLINVLIGFIQLLGSNARASIINLLLALAGCVLIAIGLVRMSLPMDIQAERLPLLIGAAGGVLILLLSFILYRSERRKEGFEPKNSSGLLNTGAGIFVLIAAIVIPFIPFQLTGKPVRINLAVSAANLPTAVTASPTPRIVLTSTPTLTPTPSDPPTPQPSLTPPVSHTPITPFPPTPHLSPHPPST